MDVLIKGMMMPINCQTCPFVKEVKYAATPEYEVVFDLRCGLTQMLADNPAFARNKDCPLVEIPPHGRLIDADAVQQKMHSKVAKLQKIIDDYSRWSEERKDAITDKYAVLKAKKWIAEAPTIIEAEVKE